MNNESEFGSESSETDETKFMEVEALIGQGWKFKGSLFQKDQTYHLLLEKEGEDDKIFQTSKAFPKAVDVNGHIKQIP